jgi:hypothetical protein
MTVQKISESTVPSTIALLDALRVSLFCVSSDRVHRALAADAARGRLDGRVAIDGGAAAGVVLAAPAAYWRLAPLCHGGVAFEVLTRRLVAKPRHGSVSDGVGEVLSTLDPTEPPRTWRNPREAWRIIFIGTSPSARSRGVAAALYRSVMADRSLVAHIAPDNAASIRLHQSLGWRLYPDPDSDVVLAVHLREATVGSDLAIG